MVAFNKENVPELPPHVATEIWLHRLFLGDEDIHFLVELDSENDYAITAHAIMVVEQLAGHKAVICHQLQDDNKNGLALSEAIEYLDKLRDAVGAGFSMFTTHKGVKAYEKKYGYTVARTVMVKASEVPDTLQQFDMLR
jgi:hypothetical protein